MGDVHIALHVHKSMGRHEESHGAWHGVSVLLL